MSEMSGALQNRIAPPVSQFNTMEFSNADVDNQVDKTIIKDKQTDFRDLIANSMENIQKEREAKELGDLSAGTEQEFFEKLAEQTKQKRDVKKEMNKDDFLKLFVAQLQNQDPLNPDDGTEMASKLAQFNGLEQMMNMNKTMEDMVKSQNLGRNLQLVNYVGKEITVDGGRVKLKQGTPSSAAFIVEKPATRTSMTIRDSTGMVVSERELGPLDVGTHPFKWDGKNDAGNGLADGLYHFSIYARDIDGNQIPIPITSKTKISGVDIQSETGDLFTDLGPIKFADIRSVGNPGYDSSRPADSAQAQLRDEAAKAEFEQRKSAKKASLENKSENGSALSNNTLNNSNIQDPSKNQLNPPKGTSEPSRGVSGKFEKVPTETSRTE